MPEPAVPSRRHEFFVVLALVNLLFLAFDLFDDLPHPTAALSSHAALTVAFLGARAILRRVRAGRAAQAVKIGVSVLAAVIFGVTVWSTGGVPGRYGTFYAFLPMVMGIMLPEDPWAAAGCGLTSWLTGLVLLGAAPVFWSLGTLSITLYAAGGAWFHRRELERTERDRLAADALARRLEEVEREREMEARLSLLGGLVASVAHELRNPLASVTLNVSMLRSDAGDSGMREVLADVESGLARIRTLVEDLRGFSKGGPEAVEPRELEPLVAEAARIAAVRLAPLAPIQHLPPGLPRVAVNPQRLVQVMVNLLVNAADALDEASGPRSVRISAVAVDDVVEVAVDDSGPGIAPEIRDRLFTPFASTKGKAGTGLGLSLSRDYLAAFGATIRAEASDLGGARFVVRLARA